LRGQWITAFLDGCGGRRVHRVPPHVGIDRLTGGIDIAATLRSGTARHDKGLLAQAGDGVLLLGSAECLAPEKAAFIAAAMDGGAAFTLIALDEGTGDESTPASLMDRVAFLLDIRGDAPLQLDQNNIAAARRSLPHTEVPQTVAEGLCQTAQALGITSLRPALMALRAARAAAALDGRTTVSDDDARIAARLVLAPRATRFPTSEPDADPPPQEAPEGRDADDDDNDAKGEPSAQELSEMLLEAVAAALPEGLLAQLSHDLGHSGARSGGGVMARKAGLKRGRPAGVRPGSPRDGGRLSLIDTLRSAAPWQASRRPAQQGRSGVIVESGDLRIRRYKEKRETTAIFVVDASGSAALHRMAEAKGAVELILADCYVRRDRTALIAFRGKTAEVLLPPTRSLQRAKKLLADLPGGGGTPLAAAIGEAQGVADQVRRGGGTPLVVFLTDGKANIARDGTPDRALAIEDAETAAKGFRRDEFRTLMIDLSDQPSGTAARLAGMMGARYLPLPHADAALISKSVSHAMKAGG
jgi:magnesium chelatase subunit D